MIRTVSIFLTLLFLAILQQEAISSLTSTRMFKNQWTVGIAGVPGGMAHFEKVVGLNTSLGGSFGYIGDPNMYVVRRERRDFDKGDYYFEGHLVYRILAERRDSPFDIGVLGGLFNDKLGTKAQFGILFDFYLSEFFTARLNMVVGPRLGFEIGYMFSRHWEFNVTFGSAVAMVGVKYLFIHPKLKSGR